MPEIKSRIILAPPIHIGIAVRDLKGAMDFCSKTLGISPLDVMDIKVPKMMFKGRLVSGVVRNAAYRWGSLHIDLIKAVSGDYPTERFLQESGEGMHHLSFAVDDLDEWLKTLSEKGLNLVAHFNAETLDGHQIPLAWFESPFGLLELFEMKT